MWVSSRDHAIGVLRVRDTAFQNSDELVDGSGAWSMMWQRVCWGGGWLGVVVKGMGKMVRVRLRWDEGWLRW